MKKCTSCNPKAEIEADESIKNIVEEKYDREYYTQYKDNSELKMGKAKERLFRELNLQSGMKVLDIGCGSGETAINIAEKIKPNGRIIGVDLSSQGIEAAQRSAKIFNVENVTEFQKTNATELQFPNNYFDRVISECVISLISDKMKAFTEILRVLKGKGKVVIHDVITWLPLPRSMKEDDEIYCNCVGGAISIEDNTRIMKEAGFVNVQVIDFSDEYRNLLNKLIVVRAIEMEDEEKFQEIMKFVRKKGIGYALFIAEKT